jgi:hypothetical protein
LNFAVKPVALLSTLFLTLGLVALSASSASADPAELAVTSSAGTLTLPSGDNYHDASSVTISSPNAHDVSVVITHNGDLTETVSAQTTLASQLDGTFSAVVPVSDDQLAAGSYFITVTALDNTAFTASTPLVIGSGQVTALTLTTTNGTTFFPYADGYKDAVTGTVSAVDETNTPVSFTGTVSSGTATTAVASTDASAATFSLSLVGQPLGSQSLVATVGTVTSPGIQLALQATQLASVSVSSHYSTVYPVSDGFRDSTVITTNVASTLPDATAITGSLKATLKGKTVATWALTSSGPTTITWNGRIHGKIKPGTYVFKASAKLGNTVTSPSVKVTVSPKKLVSKTVSSTKSASSIIKHFEAFDQNQDGICLKHSSQVGCFGYDDYYNAGMSLFAYGTSGVPAAVWSSTKYGRTPSVLVTAATSDVSGTAVWGYGLTDDATQVAGQLRKGTHSLGWHGLNGASHTLEISMGLGQYSYFITTSLKISYKYVVLK